MSWWGRYGMHHWGGFALMFLFWLLVIIAIGWSVSHFINRRETGGGSDSPKDIARRRYARGEIDEEELEEILQNLDKR